MEQPDERALIGAAVRACRRVLTHMADPMPHLSVSLQRAERLIEPLEQLPPLEVELFAALPAEAQPAEAPRLPGSPQVRPDAYMPAPVSPSGRAGPAVARSMDARSATGLLTPPVAGQPETPAQDRPPVFSFRRSNAAAPALPAPATRPAMGETGQQARQIARGGRVPEEPALSATAVTPSSSLVLQPAEPSARVTVDAVPAPLEPAGMALLRRLAAEVIQAAPRAALAADLRAGSRTMPGAMPDALPARAYDGLPAMFEDPRDARSPAALDALDAPAAAARLEPAQAGQPHARRAPGVPLLPHAPEEAAPAAVGFDQAQGRPDAAQLARLISDILVEQARRHGMELL